MAESNSVSGYSPLHLAVLDDDEESVNQLLEGGCQLDGEDYRRQTPLHLAISQGFVKAVELILAKQSNVNVQDEDGNTPVHLLFHEMHWDFKEEDFAAASRWSYCNYMCNLLIDHGADLGLQNWLGQTLLHLAVLRNMPTICKLILEKKVDVNIRDEDGRSPLFIAVMNNNYFISRMLLMKEASLNVADNGGNFIIHLAIKSLNIKLVNLLLIHGADIGVRDESGQTSLHVAVRTSLSQASTSQALLVQLLLVEMVEVNSQDDNGDTPLHMAVKHYQNNNGDDYERESIIMLLLSWGANMEIPNNSGLTPYDDAAQLQWRHLFISHLCKLRAARLLGDFNHELLIDVPYEYEYDQTCLEELDRMKLMKIGSHSIFDFICKSDDPLFVSNIKLEDPKLCFKKAFSEYHTLLKAIYIKSRLRQLLIKRALNCWRIPLPKHILEIILHNVSNADLYNLFKACSSNWHIGAWPIIITLVVDDASSDYLENQCSQSNLPIYEAIRTYSVEDLLYHIRQTPTCLHSIDLAEENILHFAVYRNFEEGVRLLLETGININIKNAEGYTPLHCAASAGHESLAELLVKYGADMDSENKAGETPLLLALRENNFYIIQLLLENGSKINLKNMFSNYVCVDITLQTAFLLEAYGANINEVDNTGKSFFMNVIKSDCPPSVCQVFLSMGADLNCKDNDGNTPLHVVSDRCEHTEQVCWLLLSKGAKVNALDNLGRTPMHKAADDIRINILKLLVSAGGDLEARDLEGKTVLHYTVKNRDAVCVRYLLENGVNVCPRDNSGKTPLDICMTVLGDFSINVTELMDWGAYKIFENSKSFGNYAYTAYFCNWECFIKCVIKLQCAKLLHFVADTSEIYKTYEESCVAELTNLKSIIFGQNSCFEVISNYNDPHYVLNNQMEEALSSKILESKFPIYSSFLYKTFIKAKKRFDLLNLASEYFKIDLPSEIVRHILAYLDDGDLTNLFNMFGVS